MFANPPNPLSDVVPPTETVAGVAGTMSAGARGDHNHPRLTSATGHTLDASAEATIAFTRTFSKNPCVDFTYIEAADNQPVVFKVKSWIQDGSLQYTGCVVKGYRASILPALSGILLVGPLISSLASFNIFGGSAAGVVFTAIALQQSTP